MILLAFLTFQISLNIQNGGTRGGHFEGQNIKDFLIFHELLMKLTLTLMTAPSNDTTYVHVGFDDI